jgi:hypothetical protein
VPVTERTLAHSVERETKSAGLYSASSCAERAGEGWRCKIIDRSGSGFADYAVTTGDQCWHATLRNDDFEGGMPARADGCATMRDLRVLD